MSKSVVNFSTLCKIAVLSGRRIGRIIKVHWRDFMKVIKKAVTLWVFFLIVFLSVHIPLAEESINPQESEVVIKHNVDNQNILHNSKPIYAIAHRMPVFMIARNSNKAEESTYHFFSGRSRQRERTLFKQRARSTIQVRSITLKLD